MSKDGPQRRKSSMGPKFSILATTTVILIAAGLFCRSHLAVGWFRASPDHSPSIEFPAYLRTKDTRSDSVGSSVLSTEEVEPDSNASALVKPAHNNGVQATHRRRLASEETDPKKDKDFYVEKTKKQHFPLFETSDIFSVIGPSVFPKPTYVYEGPDETGESNDEGDIVTYLQPTSGAHRPNQDAVLVFAAEYKLETFMLFFMTLYETGYKGDVVVGVSKMDWEDKWIRELLEHWKNENGENQMTVIVYVVPYHCYNLEGEIQSSHKGGMRVCQCHNMFGRKNQDTGKVTPLLDRRHGRTAQTIRYELYWIWSEHYEPNKWILLIDARDTIFQKPPFERVPRRVDTTGKGDQEGGTLIFFGENADATSLGKSKYNRRWLTLAYGEKVANAFASKPTICSGSTMGEQSAIETYLRAEVAESDESKTVIFGADQGFHNYLYYSNKLANAKAISKILVQDQGLGLVNNMGALRDKKLEEWGNGKMVQKTNASITIYNWDGTVAPVVHQYDRHKELSRWWHQNKYEEFRKKWDEMKQK